MRMRAKLLKRAGLGFLMGVVMGNIIAWFFGGTMLDPALVTRMGGEIRAVVIQTMVYGLYGAAAMGGTVLYEISGWPLALSSVLHWLIIAVLYVPMALLLGWASSAADLLVMEGFELVGYFLIWLIMLLRYKASVRELNELQQKNNETKKCGE